MLEILSSLLIAQAQPQLRPDQKRAMQSLARNDRPQASGNSFPNPSISDFSTIAGFSPKCKYLSNGQQSCIWGKSLYFRAYFYDGRFQRFDSGG